MKKYIVVLFLLVGITIGFMIGILVHTEKPVIVYNYTKIENGTYHE